MGPQAKTIDEQASQDKEEKDQLMVRMGHSRSWMLAFIMYANDNDGRMPAGFNQATTYIGNEKQDELLQATNHFDVMYQGTLGGITSPSTTIVLRENSATQLSDGSWIRTYAFADGHCEIHKSVDGTFDQWEAGKIIKSAGR